MDMDGNESDEHSYTYSDESENSLCSNDPMGTVKPVVTTNGRMSGSSRNMGDLAQNINKTVSFIKTTEKWDALMATSKTKLVVVDFTTTWCPTCKMIDPKFVALADHTPDTLFVKVDVDDNAPLAEKCGISSMPTFQFYKDGEKVHEFSGADMEQPLQFTIAMIDTCTTSFCLKCGEEPNAPLACKYLSRWHKKCHNESEGGEMGLMDLSDAAKAKQELDRYLDYYKRYHKHAEAQKFSRKQLTETEERMMRLQETQNNATWTDVEILKKANEKLVECRRVLKYTYCFAYYMPEMVAVTSLPIGGGGGSRQMVNSMAKMQKEQFEYHQEMQKEQFEYHQEVLERFTENLSELVEKPLKEINRESVVNQTRVVDNFMKNMLKYVEDELNCFSNTWWLVCQLISWLDS